VSFLNFVATWLIFVWLLALAVLVGLILARITDPRHERLQQPRTKAPLQLVVGYASSRGRVRSQNEDSFAATLPNGAIVFGPRDRYR
jgi:hypothetical protein